MPTAVFMPERITVGPGWVIHKDVFITLLSGRIVWSLTGNFVIINRKTKETTWPLAATERTNMSFVLFL
jgi:hypothetical protein